MSRGEILVNVGRHGSFAGCCWEDGGHGKVRQIYIRHEKGKAINSIQTINELNGGLVVLEKHGGEGPHLDMINLQPSEYITSVSGFADIVTGQDRVILSILISTNVRDYGPYGNTGIIPSAELIHRSSMFGPHGSGALNSGQDRLQFRFEVEAGKFAGFNGYSNSEYLLAIGTYVNTKASTTLGIQASRLPRLN